MATIHAEVAKLIRKFIKDNGLTATVKSKTYSGGNSVTVNLVDATPEQYDIVKKCADQFELGSFNGMTDSYEYDNLNRDIPQVKFVFVETEFSDEYRQKALDVLRNEYPDEYVDVPMSITEVDHNTKIASGEYVTRGINAVLNNDYGIYHNLWKKVWCVDTKTDEKNIDDQFDHQIEKPVAKLDELLNVTKQYISKNKLNASVESYVSNDHGAIISIILVDATPEQFDNATSDFKKYEFGVGNLNDLSEYNYCNINPDIPQVEYILIDRMFTAELRQNVLNLLHLEQPQVYKNVPKEYSKIDWDMNCSNDQCVKSSILGILRNLYPFRDLWKKVNWVL